MKKFFAVRTHSGDVDVVLLLIRLVTGFAFLLHGWGKIQHPMSWMGPESFIPAIFQALAALAEFGGGVLLILGLFTRLGALGLLITMLVAVIMHAFIMGDPFVNFTGGRSFEPATIYFLISLLILVMGPGKFSFDQKIFGFKA
jgi:putative oxidoreductase